MSAAMTRQAGKPVDIYQLDQWLMFAVVGLLLLGSIMVYSATLAGDSKTLAVSSAKILRHLMHIGLGTLISLLAAMIHLRW